MNILRIAFITFMDFTQYLGVTKALLMVSLYFALTAIGKRLPSVLEERQLNGDNSKLVNFLLFDFRSKKSPKTY